MLQPMESQRVSHDLVTEQQLPSLPFYGEGNILYLVTQVEA